MQDDVIVILTILLASFVHINHPTRSHVVHTIYGYYQIGCPSHVFFFHIDKMTQSLWCHIISLALPFLRLERKAATPSQTIVLFDVRNFNLLMQANSCSKVSLLCMPWISSLIRNGVLTTVCMLHHCVVCQQYFGYDSQYNVNTMLCFVYQPEPAYIVDIIY